MVIIDKIKSLFTVKNYSSGSSWGKSSYSFFGSWGAFFYRDKENEEKLINEGYISNEDVFAVVKKLLDSSSDIPIVLKEMVQDEKVTVTDMSNDLYRLLKRPNSDQTQKEYRREQYSNYLLTGDTFEWKRMAAGFNYPTSLKVIPSQYTEINMVNDNDYFSEIKNYQFCWGSQNYSFGPEEIIHKHGS